jgi:hypothetical protein
MQAFVQWIFSSAFNTAYTQRAKSPCPPTTEHQYIQRVLNNAFLILIKLQVTKNVGNDPACAYGDASTSLNLFAKTCNNSVWGMFVMTAAQMHSDIWPILYIISLNAQRTCSLCIVSRTVSLKWKLCHTESCLPLFSSRIYIWKACQLVTTYSKLQLAVKRAWINVPIENTLKKKAWPKCQTWLLGSKSPIQWVLWCFHRVKVATGRIWPLNSI